MNIKKLIEELGLDENELARILYPELSHPKRALKRLIDGHSELVGSQIQRLSLYTSIGMRDLYDNKFKPIDNVVKVSNTEAVVIAESILVNGPWHIAVISLNSEKFSTYTSTESNAITNLFKYLNNLEQ